VQKKRLEKRVKNSPAQVGRVDFEFVYYLCSNYMRSFNWVVPVLLWFTFAVIMKPPRTSGEGPLERGAQSAEERAADLKAEFLCFCSSDYIVKHGVNLLKAVAS
jgi:hypothetical protein